MQNLAYKIDLADEIPAVANANNSIPADACAACGESLFSDKARGTSWQAWGTFWGIAGMSNVELVCGACGEYLQNIFDDCQ